MTSYYSDNYLTLWFGYLRAVAVCQHPINYCGYQSRQDVVPHRWKWFLRIGSQLKENVHGVFKQMLSEVNIWLFYKWSSVWSFCPINYYTKIQNELKTRENTLREFKPHLSVTLNYDQENPKMDQCSSTKNLISFTIICGHCCQLQNYTSWASLRQLIQTKLTI